MITALVVMTIAYAVMLVAFSSTGDGTRISYTPGTSAGPDRLVIEASVLDVDPIRGAYQVASPTGPRARCGPRTAR
ncbi:hypothetical protein ACFFQW_13150 [Umezawaea endophytica]|uniref:Uncharacterized protein n=1 Tax=Umezawaea endophytica TaxID=1654476 RepID=A0A9X2VNX6_9PSEU|nr:hypothetical protein [Umezawaea endophytica]MCS7478718.1 hypothetical protein [Umezawaea endophytica]